MARPIWRAPKLAHYSMRRNSSSGLYGRPQPVSMSSVKGVSRSEADANPQTSTIAWDEQQEWASDQHGNRCSVKYFGTKQAAAAALKALKNCSECTNCSDCSDCSRCSYCNHCSRCHDCRECDGCANCSQCSQCENCSFCSGCEHCTNCADCAQCWECKACVRSARCTDCSACADCLDCAQCSGCSGRAYLFDKRALTAASPPGDGAGIPLRVPDAPVIANIHQRLWTAVAEPGAFRMGQWHCGTTHCRAGWVVELSGEHGRKLEEIFNTELAAMLIYRASGFVINPARFHDTDEAALIDIRRLAERQSS